MIILRKPRSFRTSFFCLALLLVSVSGVFSAAIAEDIAKSEGETLKNRDECQALLDNPPLSELHTYVGQDRGSMISENRLGKALLHVECSEAQIISYMERHGFVHLHTGYWPEPNPHSIFGFYNKRMEFGVETKGWLNRMFFADFSITASFIMLDDKILRISASATK